MHPRPPLTDDQWNLLLRECSNNVTALLDLYALAGWERPEDERLLAKIRAAGRAARKTANRLAAEAPQTEAPPVPQAADVPAAPAPAPDVAPAEEISKGDTSPWQRRRTDRVAVAVPTLTEEREFADWAATIRKEIDPDTDDATCRAALAAWHDHMTVFNRPLRWRAWAGQTAMDLYTVLAAGHAAMVEPVALRSDFARALTSGQLDAGVRRSWSWTNPDVIPIPGATVTELDVTAYFAAAALTTACGDGDPKVIESPTSSHLATIIRRPGYARLAARPDIATLRPAARCALRALDTGIWVPMPEIKYLTDRRIDVDVDQLAFWDKGKCGQRLAVWTTHVLNARKALGVDHRAGRPGAHLALKVLKSMYAVFLGGLMRSEKNHSGTQRHDWNDMVVSTGGMNALRALDKLDDDVELIGGLKDAVWFQSTGPEPLRPAGLTYSDLPDTMPDSHDQPGKWHLNRWGLITPAVVDAHTADRPGLIQRAVIATDKARQENQS